MRLAVLIFLSFFCVLSRSFSQGFVVSFAGSGLIGSANATGTNASFYYCTGVCSDGLGNIVVADQYNHKIRKISPTGVVTTFAGSGLAGSTDATGTSASFNRPYSLCLDAAGNIYVGELFNYKIRKITPAGVVTTFAGSGVSGSTNATGIGASFNYPNGLCMDALGNMYVADYFNNTIRKITPLGVVTTFAGSGVAGSTDAVGLAASFDGPSGICIDGSGNLYVSDFVNNKIRKITPAGSVSTFAGSGLIGSTDATGIAASFNGPGGICADVSGNLYVSDTYNHKIRQISPAGVVTTLAGTGMAGATDATVTLASFDHPIGVYKDAANNLFVGDPYNHKIRKIGNCTAPNSATNTTANGHDVICAGQSTTLSVAGNGLINWYTSSAGGLSVATGTNLIISNTLTAGIYTYYSEVTTCTSSINRTAISLTVNPTPIITVNSGSICLGNPFVLIPGGAITYTYSSGSQTVTPSINSNYTVSGTNAFGCTDSAFCHVVVLSLPVISANSGSICYGQTFTITPNGGVTYTYSSGSSTITPGTTTNYTVSGSDTFGCVGEATLHVLVNPLPNLTITSSKSTVCIGDSATLSANGAVNYLWNTTATSTAIIIFPQSTSNYTVTGTNLTNCSVTSTIAVSVSNCTGLKSNGEKASSRFYVFPNPTDGKIEIRANQLITNLEIIDCLGNVQHSVQNQDSSILINLENYSNGIYFIKINQQYVIKVIKH